MAQREDRNSHEPLLWDIPHLAAELGVKERLIREWVGRNKIPFVKIGGRVMFVRAAMRKFLEDAQVEPRA